MPCLSSFNYLLDQIYEEQNIKSTRGTFIKSTRGTFIKSTSFLLRFVFLQYLLMRASEKEFLGEVSDTFAAKENGYLYLNRLQFE